LNTTQPVSCVYDTGPLLWGPFLWLFSVYFGAEMVLFIL